MYNEKIKPKKAKVVDENEYKLKTPLELFRCSYFKKKSKAIL